VRGAITPKWEKTCLKSGLTAVQNVMPIGKAPAEKSVTIQNKAFTDIRLRPGIATPPKEDQAKATWDLHTKFREDRSSGSRDMLADRQTYRQTDRQTS